MKKSVESSIIIHSFAILHALACTILLSTGGSDEAILTFLTLTMVILLCSHGKMSLSFTLSSAVISNIVGYVIGIMGAGLYAAIFTEHVLANVVATFITTEIIGWLLYLIIKTQDEGERHISSYTAWLMVTLVLVYVSRILIMRHTKAGLASGAETISALGAYLSNSIAFLFLIGAGIIMARMIISRHPVKHRALEIIITSLAFMATVITGALMVKYDIPFRSSTHTTDMRFNIIMVVGAVLEIFIFTTAYLMGASMKAKAIAREQSIKAQQAQYMYLRLKQQVNPHFLFNSLNILDCLVNENKGEQASTFIRKLAGVYRYILKYEDNTLVCLKEEMDFVHQYVDLLAVRFPDGMVLDFDIPEEMMSRKVIPCSVQLLIENAIKHNVVSPNAPLSISIRCSNDCIIVTNDINPRPTRGEDSTGLGLKYIKKQIENNSERSLEIVQDTVEGKYEVALPLL